MGGFQPDTCGDKFLRLLMVARRVSHVRIHGSEDPHQHHENSLRTYFCIGHPDVTKPDSQLLEIWIVETDANLKLKLIHLSVPFGKQTHQFSSNIDYL